MKSHEHNFKQAQTTLEFLLGPIRVKDGLFIGDQLAAKVTTITLRTSNSSSAIRLPMSSIQSQKSFPISTNALAYSISLYIGLRGNKMYLRDHEDFR